MKHLFVPYTLALLAEEKGFNEPCFAYYNDLKVVQFPFKGDRFHSLGRYGNIIVEDIEILENWNKWSNNREYLDKDETTWYDYYDEYGQDNSEVRISISCSAPLYQQLIDWFREEHALFISIDTNAFGYRWYHNNIPDPSTWGIDRRKNCHDPNIDYSKYYYEALNKALEEAFKLI